MGQPAFFVHHARVNVIELHQDDFHETAPEEELSWFKENMKDKVESKWSQLLWPGHRYSFLKCERVRTSTGAWILGNQKHTDEIVSLLELKDAKSAPTPIACTREIAELELPEIDDARKTIFRTCVGIARYQLKHRGAENFAVKELSHGLSRTTEADWNCLKRFGRYLKGKVSLQSFYLQKGTSQSLLLIAILIGQETRSIVSQCRVRVLSSVMLPCMTKQCPRKLLELQAEKLNGTQHVEQQHMGYT